MRQFSILLWTPLFLNWIFAINQKKNKKQILQVPYSVCETIIHVKKGFKCCAISKR